MHAYCGEGVAMSEGRKGANGNGNGNGISVRNGGGKVYADGDREETEPGEEAREQTQDGSRDGSGDGAETGTGVETRERTLHKNGDGSRNKDEIEDGKGNEDEEGRLGGGELWYPPHQEIRRIKDQTLPLCARHHLCRQKVAPSDSQQL